MNICVIGIFHLSIMILVKLVFMALTLCLKNAHGKEIAIGMHGGRTANIRSYPFVGSFTFHLRIHICEGILVNKNTAVLPAECIAIPSVMNQFRYVPIEEYDPHFIMGITDLISQEHPQCQIRKIAQFYKHNKTAMYKFNLIMTTVYDIGAMKWIKPVVLTPTVRLVPLIPDELYSDAIIDEIIKNKVECHIPSWGNLTMETGPGGELISSNVLQVGNFNLISNEHCCKTYHLKRYDDCIKEFGQLNGFGCFVGSQKEVYIATGDAGGPIVCPYKRDRYVVGICVTTATHIPGYRIVEPVMVEYIKEVVKIKAPTAGGSKTVAYFLVAFIVVHFPLHYK